MKFTKNDEELIARVFSDENVDPDLLQPLLLHLIETSDRAAADAGELLEAIISFQSLNREFEATHGVTIDQACLELIEDANYQPVLDHIALVQKLFSVLPAYSKTARFLRAYIDKYLDAMNQRDEPEDGGK